MIQPIELKKELPVKLSNGVMSTTRKVWEMLNVSKTGNLNTIQKLVEDCPELIYAQYNYTPPIHLAVREGHKHLVKYLLSFGALDPSYKTYPFGDTLLAIATERGHKEIVSMLGDYLADSSRHNFKGDNGEIDYQRTEEQFEFEQAVDKNDLEKTEQILKRHPEFARDETYFWGEGIMLFAAKENNRSMIDLLMKYGAKVPPVLKWTQFYYFERLDAATYIMEKGMNPDTMSWHHVTILHDMAQKGDIEKAELLIKHGAAINAVEEEYQSTPLGLAARWGHVEMVELLLKKGADPERSGAAWSIPVEWAKQKNHRGVVEVLQGWK